ncbi:MAG: type I-B CRISPR-associated protein Cas8b1/Cst1 [Clostridia bacterium]|nr:type I-B CRISPR-associated protein Cas8b1/Cst1 [Clostridia bacterium]
MNTKIYLNEWFINAGIIGFIRILEHNKDNFLIIKNNYIEFDTENLKKFHKYYFKYFFDKYNVGEKLEKRIEISFGKIKTYLEDESGKKEIHDKLKNEKKYIKTTLKSQIDKIKKIDEKVYTEVQEAYNELDKVKTNEDLLKLEELKKCFIQNFYKENINKKITLNLFKSILSGSYFGQPSFLNVVKSSLSYGEQQDLMYKDYISNIVEDGILNDISKNKYGISEIEEMIQNKKDNEFITKEVKTIYSSIDKKFLQKGKSIDEIIVYLDNNVFKNCTMCGGEHIITDSYTESNFIPLAVSSANMTNFFWNQNPKFPICDLCKLILFCIPAGVTSINKIIKENDTYKEKEMLSFVNYDTDVETLLKTNNSFTNNSKKDKTQYNPYGELILNIVEQNKKVSEWELQNIFVIEFEAEYLAFSRMQYFNIKRHVTKLFKNHSNLINSINDYKYKLQIIDYILKGKDFTNVINERLRSEIEKEKLYGFNSYVATKIQYTLEILKKEECKSMEDEIKNANKKSHFMYTLGNDIHDELKKSNNENKLDGYIYKMLNCIKTNNKKDFTDVAIRIIWSTGKDIPEILVKNNENINWQELGHSFIAGLTSSRYVKEENKEVSENE